MKKWLRRVAVGLLALVGLLLLLALGAWLFLHTGPGERFAKARIVAASEGALPGNLQIGGLDLSGTTIILTDLVLRDPEGNIVARIARLEVTLSPLDLAKRRVDLERVVVVKPQLFLVLDEKGLNLIRAVKKAQLEAKAKTEPGSSTVKIRSFELTDGSIDLKQSTMPGVAPHLALEGLAATGDFSLDARQQDLDGTLELNAALTAPLHGPVSMKGALNKVDDAVSAALKLQLGGLRADGNMKLVGTEQAHLELGAVHLPEETMRAFLLQWPLIADGTLRGSVRREGNVAALDLHAEAGGAQVELGGGVDIAKLRAEGLTVQAREVDFSRLVENGPSSKVTLSLKATGGGTSLETLDGRVELLVPEASLDDQTVGPIELIASAQDGAFTVSRLNAKVPGAVLSVTGEGTVASMNLRGVLRATNLALLGRTVGRIARPEGLPLAGSGSLNFSVEGPPRHPGVALEGSFESLRYDTLTLTGLGLTASVPDVLRPLDADGDVRAQTLTVGARNFRDVHAEVVTRGRALLADVSASGFADVSLHLGGTRDEDGQGLALAEVQLRYAEATWKLQRPAHLTWGEAGTRVDELVLESGRQRITVQGGTRGLRLDGNALVENLDLQKLPRAAIPETLNLAGLLNAKVTAKGTTARPSLGGQLRLRDGRIKKFEDLSLELDGTFEQDRAVGEVRAVAFNSAVRGNFDLPVAGLLKGTDAPLRVDLAIEATKLERLFAALDVDPGLRGDAAARLHAEGTAKDPRVRIAVDGDHIQQEKGPPGDLDLIVESSADGTLVARIDLDTMGSHSYLLVTAPWTAAQFLHGPVKGRMFLEDPLTLDASFKDVPLEALFAWGLIDQKLLGKGTLTIDAKGAIKAPTGKVHLALKDAAVGTLKPFDAFATLTASEARVEVTMTALRQQARLLDLAASFEEALGGLFAGKDPERVQMTIKGELGRVLLSELRAVASTGPPAQQGQETDGVITAKLDAKGTLAEPQADLTVFADRVGVGELALGKVNLHYTYAQALSTAKVVLTSATGGGFNLDATTNLDLSAPALKRGVEWKDAPFQAVLKSEKFDPSFLSNVSPRIRSIGGRIDADAVAKGRLGAPEVDGKIEWRDGRLAMLGYGHYRNIHLAFEGTNDALVLKDLTAQSGGGALKLSARGDRKGAQYSVSGKGEFNRFPIIVDDQLRALLTGRLSLAGDASKELVFIRELAIPEARIELPEVRRKDLQDLGRRDDIVLVRKGEPLYAKSAKKKKPGGDAPAAGGAAQAGGTDGEAPARVGTRYTVLVNAPRNIWVRGTDVNAEIGLSDGFRIEYADATLLFGELRFIRGRVDVLGRRFDVLKGSEVRFAGPAKLPYVNITAEHGNERESVTVFTTIRGQGTDVTVKVSSNPALSESEIYTLLATGRRTLKRGSGSSMTGNEAASVVGAYAASQVKKVLSTKVPLDVLSIEAGSQGLADASLEAGTYVTDKIYLGTIYRLGADPERNENAAGFRLEYQISPRWSLETEYGSARSGGADLIWSRDY